MGYSAYGLEQRGGYVMATVVKAADQRTQAIHQSLASLIGVEEALKAPKAEALDQNAADWW